MANLGGGGMGGGTWASSGAFGSGPERGPVPPPPGTGGIKPLPGIVNNTGPVGQPVPTGYQQPNTNRPPSNDPGPYTGPDSDKFERGTKEYRQAVAAKQQWLEKKAAAGASLADVGIKNKKEEGQAYFRMIGGEEGFKKMGQQGGAEFARRNVQNQHWVPDGFGGFVDLDNYGNPRGFYDQYSRPKAAPAGWQGGGGQQQTPTGPGYGGLLPDTGGMDLSSLFKLLIPLFGGR